MKSIVLSDTEARDWATRQFFNRALREVREGGTGVTIRRLEELRIEAPGTQPDQRHLRPVDCPDSFVDEVPGPAQAREMEAAE